MFTFSIWYAMGLPWSSTHLSLGLAPTLIHRRKYTEGNTDSSISFASTAYLQLNMRRCMHRQAWGWGTARCEAENTLCVHVHTHVHIHTASLMLGLLLKPTMLNWFLFFFRGAEDCFMGWRVGSMVKAKPALPEDLSLLLVPCWEL